MVKRDFRYKIRQRTTVLPLTNLSIQANHAVFAINNIFKISKLPKNLSIKIFNSLIAPIFYIPWRYGV